MATVKSPSANCPFGDCETASAHCQWPNWRLPFDKWLWSVAICQLPVANCQLEITTWQLPIGKWQAADEMEFGTMYYFTPNPKPYLHTKRPFSLTLTLTPYEKPLNPNPKP